MNLEIAGEILSDNETLERYSKDKSPYVVKPKFVVIPKNENDLKQVVIYATKNNLSITARAAGTNLTGSAVGSGIIIDFSQMDAILKIRGNFVRIQPGILYDELNNRMKKAGFFLPYAPSSGDICTVGGNVATKASGLHGVKYGSIDSQIRGIRFIDVKGRTIDTSKTLPTDLSNSIMNLRKKLLADDNAMNYLKKREGLKISSGYNIFALYKYKRPEDIVTHLMVGSVGSLGLITAIDLELTKLPQEKMTCLAYFKKLEDAGKAVKELIDTKPSAVEILDSLSIDLIRNDKTFPDTEALLVIEYDENIASSKKSAEEILKRHATEYQIETDPTEQKKIWDLRESLFLRVEKESNENKKSISFIEDVTVPVENLSEFIKDLQDIFKRNHVSAVIYGHASQGNLHLKPLIEREGWKDMVKKLSDEVYKATFKYGGTVAGEHGAGRNKSPYLRQEWGNHIYSYFREIKKIFDPEDIFNPGVMFTSDDITKNMEY